MSPCASRSNLRPESVAEDHTPEIDKDADVFDEFRIATQVFAIGSSDRAEVARVKALRKHQNASLELDQTSIPSESGKRPNARVRIQRESMDRGVGSSREAIKAEGTTDVDVAVQETVPGIGSEVCRRHPVVFRRVFRIAKIVRPAS